MEFPRLGLSDLPDSLLLDVMERLDRTALCALAQTSRAFLRLAGTERIWGGGDWRPLLTGDRLTLAVRLCMSRALHLPPQVFIVQDDMGRRSNRFPLSVPTVNLRALLSTPHADEVANQAAARITDQIHRAARKHACSSWGSERVAPADVFSVARADGMSVRFALRPPGAAQIIMKDLALLGWPERWPHAGPIYAALESQCWARLRLGASQCIKSLHLQGQYWQACQELSMWLGPLDELAAEANSTDLQLLMTARITYQMHFCHKTVPREVVVGIPRWRQWQEFLQAISLAVKQHAASTNRPLLGSLEPAWCNSLTALANLLHMLARISRDPPDGTGLKAKLPARDRLMARVHLEALRAIEWAFVTKGPADQIYLGAD